MLQTERLLNPASVYRFICYGMISGDHLYRIMYLAPVRYYFDKDLSTFENVVRSFRLTK